MIFFFNTRSASQRPLRCTTTDNTRDCDKCDCDNQSHPFCRDAKPFLSSNPTAIYFSPLSSDPLPLARTLKTQLASRRVALPRCLPAATPRRLAQGVTGNGQRALSLPRLQRRAPATAGLSSSRRSDQASDSDERLGCDARHCRRKRGTWPSQIRRLLVPAGRSTLPVPVRPRRDCLPCWRATEFSQIGVSL
jgi:hypothetical protein